ncbi:hypothetical protein WOSG25_070410 [Weissella oryzae SG25]|uniref:Uncharacterized protein n=1 Tax=Weissella oryzae (strain DSM 25784 / JCM 18191 / LMG 30913 / SG25) TaxID=1329250 RepID=A0A069CU84_WEIOS|nr:hypothetical protein [Weissella oryzae]GAK31064.1 hypothetical protein WOSG25_070410 [Weissella oryzae SG25]
MKKQTKTPWVNIVLAMIAFLSIGFMIGSMLYFTIQKTTYEAQIRTSKQQTKALENQILDAKKDTQPGVSSATEVLNTFFNGYYTYNTQSEYDSRTKRLKTVATDDVLKDEKVFQADPYKKVKQLDLQSTFKELNFFPTNVSASEVTGYVYVAYSANYANKNAGNSQALFLITYDRTTKQLSKVQGQGELSLNSDSKLYE